MLSGEKFKLDTPTIGLAANRRQQVLIPGESIIEIVSVRNRPQTDGRCPLDGQPLTMFMHDVDVRGVEGWGLEAPAQARALRRIARIDQRRSDAKRHLAPRKRGIRVAQQAIQTDEACFGS